MQLTSLTLTNYRNYEKAALSFSPQLNILLGENAQGKTNLLESIYVLAFARSHRSTNEKEWIRWEEDFTRISGRVQKAHKKFELEMMISNKGKKTKINGLEQRKLSDYIGSLNVVLFAPEDLNLVKGSPQNRRKFIDMELGQVNPHYLYQLGQYQRLLKQRNHLLKQQKQDQAIDPILLEVLNEQFAEAGSHVLHTRLAFIQKLEKWAQQLHYEISHQKEHLRLSYQSTVPIDLTMTREEIQQQILFTLEKQKKREWMQQSTLIGPHRDDLLFFINEQNVQTYGSQGQQRTTALSLKLAEIDLIHEEIDEYPILLLDDVLSELDNERQVHLMKTVQNKVQTFLTTTTLDHLGEEGLKNQPTIFNVSHGTIEPIERKREKE